MWYFCWILGIGVALGFGVINAMWLENEGSLARMRSNSLDGRACRWRAPKYQGCSTPCAKTCRWTSARSSSSL